MKPILFPSNETAFTSQGLGALSDAISCTVREERNGEYELTMEYPIGGIHYDEIGDRCIIFAKPSPYRNPQPFRIYSIETNLNGIAIIHAHHLSYDLSGIAVSPFTAGSCSSALSGLLSHSVVDNPFSCWTDKSVDGQYKLVTPNSFRACLGGEENSILDVYGKGEYEFDTFDVKLHTNRGSDNGVVIAYGKNLTDFNMERNLESVTTAVYPYWQDVESGEIVELDDKIIQLYDPSVPIYLKESGGDFLAEVTNKLLVVHGVFDFDNVMVLDLSSEFEEKPSQYELFNRARKYIIDNQIARPRISIDVSFVDLASTEEYKNSPIEQVDLCDIVTVRFPLIGIEVKAEIVSIETDVLLDRYNSVQIGDVRTTLDVTLAQATLAPSKAELKAGLTSAADYINNTKGTFEWIDNGDSTNGGFTIYENGTSSWLRCTAGGIGISEDGGLTYTNAITKNGVVASQVDVQKDGHPLFYAGYDEETDGTIIQAYHKALGNPEYQITSGKWMYQGQPLEDSWVSNVSLLDPETGEERIYFRTAKLMMPSDTDYTYVNGLMIKSGEDTDGNQAYVSASSNILENGLGGYNATCHVGISVNNGGSMNITGNTVNNFPMLAVQDPTWDMNTHYLRLMKITISGTQYFMLASTT